MLNGLMFFFVVELHRSHAGPFTECSSPSLKNLSTLLLALPIAIDGISRVQCSSGRDLVPTARQNMLQGGQDGIDALTTGVVAHQANAQQMTLKRPKTSTHFDAIFIEQQLAYRELIHAIGETNSGQD